MIITPTLLVVKVITLKKYKENSAITKLGFLAKTRRILLSHVG